jgi:hypothetical protein
MQEYILEPPTGAVSIITFRSVEEFHTWRAALIAAQPPAEDSAPPAKRAKKEKKPKREGDRRGDHTKLFHDAARAYRKKHPEMGYRDCYRIVAAAAAAGIDLCSIDNVVNDEPSCKKQDDISLCEER